MEIMHREIYIGQVDNKDYYVRRAHYNEKYFIKLLRNLLERDLCPETRDRILKALKSTKA